MTPAISYSRLANAETVLSLTGYAVGTVPAFGHTGSLAEKVAAIQFATQVEPERL